jgi:hypothetical protein
MNAQYERKLCTNRKCLPAPSNNLTRQIWAVFLLALVTASRLATYAATPRLEIHRGTEPSVVNLRVIDAYTNLPFTVEVATNLEAAQPQWVPLHRTNVARIPHDLQVPAATWGQTYYRVNQFRTVLVRDDFNGTGQPNPALWSINQSGWWWCQGRTFRPSWVYHPAGPFPFLEDGKCVLEHHKYNPYHLGTPKTTFMGGEIHSIFTLSPTNAAYRVEARVRVNACPSGLVAAFFLYGYNSAKGKSDEIDNEYVSKQFNDNAQWRTGDPVMLNTWNDSVQHPRYAAGTNLALSVWNTFRIYWFPGRQVDWTWLSPNGEVLLRSETKACIPDEPTQVYFNFWAPDAAWSDAYDAAFQPAQQPSDNVIHRFEIDYVEVRTP